MIKQTVSHIKSIICLKYILPQITHSLSIRQYPFLYIIIRRYCSLKNIYKMIQFTDQIITSLLRSTYTSTNTQEIKIAQDTLMQYIISTAPESFVKLQAIMANKNNELDHNSYIALGILIKKASIKIVNLLTEMTVNEQEKVMNYKRILFAVEHIFDNNKISGKYKLQIGNAFVQLFVFYSPESGSRIISKSRYFFNTKEELLGLNLIQAYYRSKAPFKYRAAYYQLALEQLIDCLNKKLVVFLNQNAETTRDDDLHLIYKYLQLLEDIWTHMTFQKFESVFDKIFKSATLIKVFQIFTNCCWHQNILSFYYSIIAQIIISLGRCQILQKYQQLHKAIQRVSNKCYQKMFQNQRVLSVQLNPNELQLLIAAIKYGMVECNFDSFNLFVKLIYPNFKLFQRYMTNNSNNEQQIFKFLEDACFSMQSQCTQILHNKLIKTICKKSAQTASSFRILMNSFIFKYLSQASRGQILQTKINYDIASGIAVWQQISQIINLDQQILTVFLTLSLQVTLLSQQQIFLRGLESFMSANIALMFQKSQQITFYSILIYRNYMDDIFGSNQSTIVRLKLISLLSAQHQSSIITNLALQVQKQKLALQLQFNYIQIQVNQIVRIVRSNYRENMMPLVQIIFKEYGNYIQPDAAVSIATQCMKKWAAEQNSLNFTLNLQVVQHFFSINTCSHKFSQFITSLLTLASQRLPLIQKNADEFLLILRKTLIENHSLPQGFQLIVMQLNLLLNISVMQSLNSFIGYSKNPQFFNWLALSLSRQQLNLFSTLLLQNLIYYGHSYLRVPTIISIIGSAYITRVTNKNHFNYLNGKINNIFILLMRYNWDIFIDLLIHQDWSNTRQRVLQNFQLSKRMTKQFPPIISRLTFPEQIYELVYLHQNVYRWKYDIDLFVINQIWLLSHRLNNDYQLAYANVTFVACLLNVIRSYDFVRCNYIDSDGDSDDSLYHRTNIEKQYRRTNKVLEHFQIPEQYKQINIFKQFRQLINKLKANINSQKWLETILSVTLIGDKAESYMELMKMEQTEGGFRKINRIKRIIDD